MSELTNETRADRAYEAAMAYVEEAGPYGIGSITDEEELRGEWTSILADLVCDLQHLAKQKGLEWDLIAQVGESNFIAECEEEGENE
jgi:hypothetical protein